MAHNRAHRRLFPVAMKDGKVNTGKSQQGEKTCNGIRKNSQRPSAQEEAEEKQQDQAQPNRRYRKRKIHANLASRIWQPAVHRIRSTEMQEIIDPDRATKEVVNERIAISRALAVGHLSEVVHRNAVGERKGEIQRKKNLIGGPNVVIIQRWSSCHSGAPVRFTTQRSNCKLAPLII